MSATLFLSACGSEESTSNGGSTEKVQIIFNSGGGAYQDAESAAWIQPFNAATPTIEVVEDSPTDYAKLKAMVEANAVTLDIETVGNDFGIGQTEQYLEKLDPSVIPFADLQPDKFPTNGYRVPIMVFSTVIAYRQDLLGSETPTTFADFFDLKKFPGRRGCFNQGGGGGLLEMALIADGVAPDQLYPLDLERAFRKIDTIKPSIIWWTKGSQSAQLLVDGEVTMGMSWNGRIATAQDQGAAIDIMWGQHMISADYAVIPKGAPHVAEATKLLQWMTSPEHNADLSKFIPYGPTNTNALTKLGPQRAERLPTSHLDTAVTFDDVWMGDNIEQVNQEWQKYVQQ